MERFAQLIKAGTSFLVTTHQNPDGDGLGAQTALHLYLKKIGKQSVVINPSPTPEKFELVDPKQTIQVYDKAKGLPKVDVILVVDTNELKMLGPMADPVKNSGSEIAFVDHHVPEVPNPKDHLIDESFSSSGELVYHFLREQRADIDSEMAVAIYVAIFTDTGGFRYKRTTPQTHEVAAELLKKGVQPETTYQSIFGKDSVGKIRLLGRCLDDVHLNPSGKIAWIEIPKALREKYQASSEDTESFIAHLARIRNVAITALFREEDDGTIKMSLRGIGEVPVIGIAKKFGGGGHRHAAGARVKSTLKAVVAEALKEAELSLL